MATFAIQDGRLERSAGPVGQLPRCCVTLAAPVAVWSATHTHARAYGQRRCTDIDTAFTVLAVSSIGHISDEVTAIAARLTH